ncbi:MAG: hypothetical protein ACKPKO_23500, partial [Candidatus Fonsibacter sp.]
TALQQWQPPVPASSPHELLQHGKDNSSTVVIQRFSSVSAIQNLLSKHLARIAALDMEIDRQFTERASLQVKCQTEHQRLMEIFKDSDSPTTESTARGSQEAAGPAAQVTSQLNDEKKAKGPRTANCSINSVQAKRNTS